jgi:hypothetical protein
MWRGKANDIAHPAAMPLTSTLRIQELGDIPGANNLQSILGERKAAAKAVRFMEQTGTLGHFGVRV